jgi:sugar transferase (PEP-CTERM/EpsH1 system associated)
MKKESLYVEEARVTLQTGESGHKATANPGPTMAINGPSLRAPERLRILHFFSYLGLGGTELTALRMVNSLDKSLFESQLCGIRGFDPQVTAARCRDATIISLPSGPSASRIQIFALRDLIEKLRPHIVHSRNWGTIEVIPAARMAGVPIIIHSEHGYEMDSLAGLPLRRRFFRRAVYGMATAMFAVTGELQQFHAQQAWVSPSRIRVLSNGIDTQLFSPRPELRRSVLEIAGIPTSRFILGTVGRLVPIKDHTTLLKAAELLAQRGVDVHVLLAGAGPELTRHQKFLERSPALANRVTFLGSRDDISQILNGMDVFVLPSFSEGMSNTLIEAMACELPVLATRVGGNPEVVGSQLADSLFAPGDVDGLAASLERLAQDSSLRRTLGKVARQRAVSSFSLECMVGNYQQLYLEMAERRRLLKRIPG